MPRSRLLILAITTLSAVICRAQEQGDAFAPAVAPASVQSESAFEWGPALNQSLRFLVFQHGFRLAFQPGTRARLRGPFFRDWGESIKATKGWGDGDHPFINYVEHPMQGAVTAYIQVHNDPRGRMEEFGRDRAYWRSRLKALAWNVGYSIQFEFGPVSESSLGNVGQRKGTSGYTDHIMTPAGGFALTLAEDALDRFLIKRMENNASGRAKAFYRTAFNPSRAFANVLRGKKPWHRDSRGW